jgi:hypothetical protein
MIASLCFQNWSHVWVAQLAVAVIGCTYLHVSFLTMSTLFAAWSLGKSISIVAFSTLMVLGSDVIVFHLPCHVIHLFPSIMQIRRFVLKYHLQSHLEFIKVIKTTFSPRSILYLMPPIFLMKTTTDTESIITQLNRARFQLLNNYFST